MLSTVAILLGASFAHATKPVPVSTTCVSYGIDFQNGGTYFQNISSTDPFTFTSQFEGCQPDVCHNILVDPNGDEVQCSETHLTPSGENMVSTCPTLKDQLTTGEYSVLLVSNNGNGTPIAYERDFNIIAGVPTTLTTTPTVTATVSATAISSDTATSTLLVTTHVNTTITVPSTTIIPTATSRPRTTTTITETVGTIYEVSHTVEPVFVTETATATCSFAPRQPYPDPWCTNLPSIIPIPYGLQTQPWSAKFRRETYDRIVPIDKDQRIRERKARLAQRDAVAKRGLDSSTVWVTCMSTESYPTSTETMTATTSVMTMTTQATSTTTETDTFTTIEGATTLPTETITLHTRTITRVRYTVVTDVFSTATYSPTVVVTTTFTPPGALPSCTQQGGWMW